MEAMQLRLVIACNAVADQGVATCTACRLHWQFRVRACNVKTVISCRKQYTTLQQTSGGCNVTSCDYSGLVNGTIASTLSTSLQPRCPGQQQFPQLIAPPTVLLDSQFSPSPSPSVAGGIPSTTNPRSSVVPSSGVFGSPQASGPAGSASGSPNSCSSIDNYIISFPIMLVLGLFASL